MALQDVYITRQIHVSAPQHIAAATEPKSVTKLSGERQTSAAPTPNKQNKPKHTGKLTTVVNISHLGKIEIKKNRGRQNQKKSASETSNSPPTTRKKHSPCEVAINSSPQESRRYAQNQNDKEKRGASQGDHVANTGPIHFTTFADFHFVFFFFVSLFEMCT